VFVNDPSGLIFLFVVVYRDTNRKTIFLSLEQRVAGTPSLGSQGPSFGMWDTVPGTSTIFGDDRVSFRSWSFSRFPSGLTGRRLFVILYPLLSSFLLVIASKKCQQHRKSGFVVEPA